MGGASQVLCLPRAAAKRILRTEARIHSGKENWATIERLPVAAVSALCTGFGAEVGQWPCRGYLDGVGTHVGRRLSGPSEFRERTPPGSPVSRPLGAFDFHTRIISAALGTFPGSTSKIFIHSSSTKKIAHRCDCAGGLHGYNLYLILPGGRICLNGVVAILNEMRR